MTNEVPATPVIDVAAVDLIAAELAKYGITDAANVAAIKALGAESVSDLANLTEADLKGAGIAVLKARKIISALRPIVETKTAAAAAETTMSIDTILPSVPDDTSWLAALRTGGILKVDQSSVISAIRAALADRFGLYDIPKRLVEAMEEYVDVTEEQVTEEFWKLRKQLTRKSYGDLFAAIDGLDGSYITDTRKRELLSRLENLFWPALITFNETLKGWQESWMAGAANPGMMIAAMAAMGGGGGIGLPPGMMSPPDCSALRDAAAAVNDTLNRAFRGTGVQVAAALAYEANQIKAMLENTRLASLCGQPTRELLLKKLNVNVPATYPRLETNITKFALGIMQADRIPSGNDELQYFGTMYMLGSNIPWNELNRITSGSTTKRPAGIGSRRGDRFLDSKDAVGSP